jgi:hypothetical protein
MEKTLRLLDELPEADSTGKALLSGGKPFAAHEK